MPNRATRSAAALALAISAALVSACGARRLELPSGTGDPFPAHEQAYRSATEACSGIRTITAEIRVAGKVGRQKIRGRVLAGLSRPDKLRLEGVAPFGAPAFILAATGGEGTLLLPRDPAILEAERPGAILDALIGVDLEPDALLAILAGCPVPGGEPVAGFSFGGIVRVDLAEGGRAFLRSEKDGAWVLLSSVSGPLRVDYADRSGRTPGQLHLWVDASASTVDLRLQVAEADTNVDLGPEAFEVNVPPRAVRITLDELRHAGPLSGR